jgi:cell wall-associated NlpC family hydrolase
MRPRGRRSAAALAAALSVVATGVVVATTPGSAYAANTVYRGQIEAASLARPTTAIVGPAVSIGGVPRATHATLTVDRSSVQTGQSIVFSGRLTFSSAKLPVRDQALRLQSSTGGEWKTVGDALANDDGTVTFTVKPTASAKYRLAFAGVRAISASVSPEQAVTVRVPVTRTSSGSSSGSGGRPPASVANIGSHGVQGSATALAFLEAARAQSGKSYVYATAGPNTFDCSGLVMYVAAQFGLSLPHNANSQKGYGNAVAAEDAAPGDLIFFLDGGYAYHVGIYAGGGKMIDAPNARTTVGLHTIWGSNVVFRRIF